MLTRLHQFSAGLLAAIVIFSGGFAAAHHSTSIFDQSKEFSIDGTVVEWYRGNPHSTLRVEAEGPDGSMQIYSLDFGNGDRILKTYNLDERDSFESGDRIRATGSPSRLANDPRLLVTSMILPDGRVAGGGSHSGPRQGDGERTGPPWAVDPSITIPVTEITGVLTALEWTDPEIIMTVSGTHADSDKVLVYQVRAGAATVVEERQFFTSAEFPIGGKVSMHGYLIPEEGNLFYPLNIWTDTRDMYNQTTAINRTRDYLGLPPMDWGSTQRAWVERTNGGLNGVR